MALNNDTNFPPSGLAPYRIDRTWCLGDSLPYLNANFTNFDTRIDANTTALAAASATLTTNSASTSSTIITTLSTVPYARLNDGNQSGIAPIFGARAWVNFDMTRDSTGASNQNFTDRFIRAAGNVGSVTRLDNYSVRINFIVPMLDNNYAVATNSDRNDIDNNISLPSIKGGAPDIYMNANFVDMYLANPNLMRRVTVTIFR